jgi:hypothetical protein
MMTRRLLLPLILLLVLPGCVSRDPVQALLEDLQEAAEERDGDAVGRLLAADFTAGDGSDREALTRTAKQYLAAYRALDVEFSEPEVNRRGPSARIKFRAKITGVGTSFGGMGDLVPKQATYDFDLTARETEDGWKVASASWSAVD